MTPNAGRRGPQSRKRRACSSRRLLNPPRTWILTKGIRGCWWTSSCVRPAGRLTASPCDMPRGVRPERNRNIAIAEWPTASGPADYAIFAGRTLVGVVEAKRKRKNVMSAVDLQATRYSKDIQPDAFFDFAGGPWDGHKAPFIFATNGRSFYPAVATHSGIWFRDTRDPANASRALEAWFTPRGVLERLDVDSRAAERELDAKQFSFGFTLRPYQIQRPRRSTSPRRCAACGGEGRAGKCEPASGPVATFCSSGRRAAARFGIASSETRETGHSRRSATGGECMSARRTLVASRCVTGQGAAPSQNWALAQRTAASGRYC
ncbi:type I restriction endonuclease [Rhodobacter sp. CZR27]|uniref:type I restriction endonuclease n=1 Tax=Rhodobacter sp. CZR27 TaxID=2033869 RepID=UPI000BBF1E9A